MLERLELLHRRLAELPRKEEEPKVGLLPALERIREVASETFPELIAGTSLPPLPQALRDAEALKRGEPPEDPAYAFWLHQGLRLLHQPRPTSEEPSDACPACGGLPDVAYLDSEGRRYYVCAFCDTPWRAPRLACPACGEHRAEALAYYALEPYRIYTCRTCGNRFAAQDLRLKEELDLPALRALTAWYAGAEEEDVAL